MRIFLRSSMVLSFLTQLFVSGAGCNCKRQAQLFGGSKAWPNHPFFHSTSICQGHHLWCATHIWYSGRVAEQRSANGAFHLFKCAWNLWVDVGVVLMCMLRLMLLNSVLKSPSSIFRHCHGALFKWSSQLSAGTIGSRQPWCCLHPFHEYRAPICKRVSCVSSYLDILVRATVFRVV